MDERLERLQKKARGLPLMPGVYIMKDKNAGIIYIGKAKALKNRVSQYFGKQENHAEKVRQMVSRAENFDYIICDSEFEALVLESSLIKQHAPKYNILLKDDKGYHYIKITNGDYPRISAEKAAPNDGSRYLGPYTSSMVVTQSVDEALKLFRLPQCSRVFPRDIGRGRPCLNHFIGQCAAVCGGRVSQREYNDAVSDALDYLKGGAAHSVERLEARMQAAADELDFEKAARLRDRIAAIKKLGGKQKVIMSRVPEQDIIALAKGSDHACFEVFRFLNARLYDQEHFIVESPGEPASARTSFIMQYYSMRERIPPRIEMDESPDDLGLLLRWIREKSGRKVQIHVPQKGEHAQLVEMCKNNAAQRVARKSGRTIHETKGLDELSALLGLNKPPRFIEAYDISNTAGSDNVAGMVVFCDGRPLKSDYRKFKIKSFEGQDDYASMREIIERRIAEYEKHEGEPEGFGRLPDLILLDGGRGQVSAVLPALHAAGLEIPVFGMVKDSHHKTRAITSEGDEIAVKATRAAYTLISTIQEEVHRFAVGYHNQRRKKRAFSSSLTEIPGVGETRAKALLKHFKTIAAIGDAEIDELRAVKGVSLPAAENIYNHFHPGGETREE